MHRTHAALSLLHHDWFWTIFRGSAVGIILSSFILILFWDVVVGLEIRLLWEVNELNILMRLKLSREFIPVLKNQNIKSYNKTKGNYFLRDTIMKYIKSAVISKTENLCTSIYLQYVMRKILSNENNASFRT